MVTAIIVAAGSSRRMGFDKLAAEIGEVAVLTRSLLAFEKCDAIDRIHVVTSEERFEWVRAQAAAHQVLKLDQLVAGGAERYLSVKNGLDVLSDSAELVAVHDAARPLVTPVAISRCVDEANRSGASALAHRVTDTLKRATQQGQVIDSVSRENLWAMETPQVFDIALLRRAYARILESGEVVTDEVSAVQALGEPVRLVENDSPNPKITVPADIQLAEAMVGQI
ncbi:MAG: 2-C-methyl-D-erythritol 4-phosphate cytidylyltransferase [Verrucomicrobiae bacterium]|nr:2-C-methyl-D-erythritol 4-phosphate cytidylyltransferase [Verrucomicrobiae bacterium]